MMDFNDIWLVISPVLAGIILMLARPLIAAGVDYLDRKAKLVGIEMDDAMRDKLHTALNSLVSTIVARYVSNNTPFTTESVLAEVARKLPEVNPDTIKYFNKDRVVLTAKTIEGLAAQYVPGALERFSK